MDQLTQHRQLREAICHRPVPGSQAGRGKMREHSDVTARLPERLHTNALPPRRRDRDRGLRKTQIRAYSAKNDLVSAAGKIELVRCRCVSRHHFLF